MLSIIKNLKYREEVTVFQSPLGTERRVRREGHLFKVFDINWAHQRCWHIEHALTAVVAWRIAQHVPPTFLNNWQIVFGPTAKRGTFQFTQNQALKERIFRYAKHREKVGRGAFVCIMGGKG